MPCEGFLGIPLGSCLSRGISVNGYISYKRYFTEPFFLGGKNEIFANFGSCVSVNEL
jgi:hypothetical protein